MSFDTGELEQLHAALQRLSRGFDDLPRTRGAGAMDGIPQVLDTLARRLQDNYPYHHPLYAGQMLKPPHPLARLAYTLALWLNPNNHALDGGRASSAMEKEAVGELARMFGWSEHLGHLTGGGTMANLEALWVASRLAPSKRVVASSQAHYTHARMCEVLSVPFSTVAVDARGAMDLDALESTLKQGDVATVVASVGGTAFGSIDPVRELLGLRERYGFRLHVDAAYGGYFILAENLAPAAREAYAALQEVDSIVVDPHKHGLQPYGCGCVLFRDPSVGRLYRHDSPYTYFTSAELHLGEISLECSRPGASAVALWATQQLLPLEPGGIFAADLSKCRQAALEWHRRLAADTRFLVGPEPALDIVVWALAARAGHVLSERSRRAFDAAAERHLHFALLKLPPVLAEAWWPGLGNAAPLTCLRSCLMKPEHLDWLERLWAIFDEATGAVLSAG